MFIGIAESIAATVITRTPHPLNRKTEKLHLINNNTVGGELERLRG
jgi:hypothetical protein